MPQDWLRLHRSAINNPKVQKLGLEAVGFWCNCLCASRDDGSLPSVQDLAWLMRVDVTVCETFLKRLHETGLVELDGENYRLHDWEDHQFKSDTSTNRVRKHRQKSQKSAETDVKRFSSVSETPPETETETETDTEKKVCSSAQAADPPANSVSEEEFRKAVAAYNAAAVDLGWPLCERLTEKRRRSLARILRTEGLGPWMAMFNKSRDSPFLTGKSKPGNGHDNWRPSVDFFLRPDTMTKVFEGAYDGRH